MMTTVGETLANARAKKNLDLVTVEKAIKIRAKFLEALEKNEFDKLPPGTFVKGFIKNYAAFLGLPVEETLAFYRRQANEEKIPALANFEPRIGRIALTPQFFTTAGIGLLLVLFFAYLAFSYFQFAGAPPLLVNVPENNLVVNQESVEVIGKTDPQATLVINGQTVALTENGSFDVKIPLQPGLNTLTITATNKYQRQTTVVRNLRQER